MEQLELVARFIRLPIVILLAVIGYIAIMDLETGLARSLLGAAFWPFVLATLALEVIGLCNCLPRCKRKTHQSETPAQYETP